MESYLLGSLLSFTALVLWLKYYYWVEFPPKESEVLGGGEDVHATVIIHWCGGCGFQDRFEATRDILIQKFPVGVK